MQILSGQIFNRLTTIRIVGKNAGRCLLWECKCICGNNTLVASSSLRNGKTKSCGCLQKEHAKHARPIVHGESKGGKVTTEYNTWAKMKERCNNPNNKRYSDYGGRGIKVCGRWQESFSNFLEDMGRKPGPEYSLDRWPDMNGNYELANCRWGTDEQQNRGRRSNIWIEYDGERKILKDWATHFGINYGSLHSGIKRDNKPFKEILNSLLEIKRKKCPQS